MLSACLCDAAISGLGQRGVSPPLWPETANVHDSPELFWLLLAMFYSYTQQLLFQLVILHFIH